MLAFLSGVALPFTTALAHVITLRLERRQTPGASLLDIGVLLSQIATSMQLLAVMTQIRISWEAPLRKADKQKEDCLEMDILQSCCVLLLHVNDLPCRL